MAHHIFVLLGKSASGKDSVCHGLLAQSDLRLCPVVPYTTRPMRQGETEGREYHFVTGEQFLEMKHRNQVIEARRYDTCYGPWYYFTADDGQICLKERDSLLIGTLACLSSLRSCFGTAAVVPIYLEADPEERRRRALAREQNFDPDRLAELNRRFQADEADFSEEKLQEAGIRYRFRNRDLEQCIAAVGDCIRALEDSR